MIDAVWDRRRRRHLGFLRELTLAQARLRDQSSALGFLWCFLHPLLMLAVLWVCFRSRLGQDIRHYAVFLLLGIVHFTHFSKSTAAAMRALHRMSSLARNVIFPKEILVLSSVLSDAPELLISLPLVVVVSLLSGVPASFALLVLPLVMALQLLVVLGMGLLLCTLYVFVRDLDHIYGVALRLLMFVTPIFYDVRELGPGARALAGLNPLALLIGFSRAAVLEGRLPPVGPFLGLGAASGLLLGLALLTFRRSEQALLVRL